MVDELTVGELRAEHARLARQLTHWEHEQVTLWDAADRAYAARQYAATLREAAAIKRQIDEQSR